MIRVRTIELMAILSLVIIKNDGGSDSAHRMANNALQSITDLVLLY